MIEVVTGYDNTFESIDVLTFPFAIGDLKDQPGFYVIGRIFIAITCIISAILTFQVQL